MIQIHHLAHVRIYLQDKLWVVCSYNSNDVAELFSTVLYQLLSPAEQESAHFLRLCTTRRSQAF